MKQPEETILADIDKLIRKHILELNKEFSQDKYDRSNNIYVRGIQTSKPRCADGCTCIDSRGWRSGAIRMLNELETGERQ